MLAYNPYELLDTVPSFALRSDDLDANQPLALAQYGAAAGGGDLSPHLRWSDFPEQTRSFAVTCFDPDAPTGAGYWHWAVFNLPLDVTELAAGAGSPDSDLLPEGAITLPNDARVPAFAGAGPPEGTGVHRYIFAVHAVDVPTLDIDPTLTPTVLGFNLHFHTLGRALLTGLGEFGGAQHR
ncbi:YbhB/YbcL family Raf kinase inhibitor-like protein [Mycetocola spongiae]|uniref:YbhB/YbcL family Raf kinase inhibitor-like protein n=1 Tax=Mycetocola spongiae TaxID=2859226 RepID=UPI001CF50E86|nr:YbhB/YbcL family Raf kinase inhibitor-like protein [Mycetocola spongiae]UCR89753.1 YbhB/YbcL family Raf kinase inhibitor-like protein [Mycetocola spongiae]